jgi:hypothetical protein
LKKAAQKLSDSGPGALASQQPRTQINKSFLLLFYKKAVLHSNPESSSMPMRTISRFCSKLPTLPV